MSGSWWHSVSGKHLAQGDLLPDCLLPVFVAPTLTQSMVVDFGHIVSLPIDYLENHAALIGNRWRLGSPFLEHYSQAFARFFMRVGLPSGIAQFS